jgi:hypothetical protein
MKKLAVSSLALALWINAPAEAQGPFFQGGAQPLQPAAALRPAMVPPGGLVPVRVHFGGALTRDGVVPVPVYMNHPVGPAAMLPPAPMLPPAHQPAPAQHPSAAGKNLRAVSTQPALSIPAAGDAVQEPPRFGYILMEDIPAPEVTDPRFVGPDVEHLRRPRLAPRGYRWYTSAEYLHYWVKQQESPELLLIDGTPITAADVDARTRHGGRFALGRWLDTPHHVWALEGLFMFTGTRRAKSTFTSTGVVILSRPFIDADLDVPDEVPVAIDPPALDPRSGRSEIEAASRMWGFEVNLRRELCRSSCGHLDFIVGYRQFHLDEAIAVRDRILFDPGPGPLAGATVNVFDEFGTHNRLFAGQVGVEGEYNWRRFYVDAWGKFALGMNQEVINISGGTSVRGGGLDGQNFVGGVLAQPSNIGRFEDNQVTVMPEAGVNVGFKITPNWRLGAGYTFLYLNNVVRPGDAIDPAVDSDQIPLLNPFGPGVGARPAPPTFRDTNYWAHGFTVQMEIRY